MWKNATKIANFFNSLEICHPYVYLSLSIYYIYVISLYAIMRYVLVEPPDPGARAVFSYDFMILSPKRGCQIAARNRRHSGGF
jgi:hypothetical protein